VSIPTTQGAAITGAQHGEPHDAIDTLAAAAADRFDQIGALGQTLLLLIKSPQFFDAPWLAAYQLHALIHLAENGSADVQQIAGQGVRSRNQALIGELLAVQSRHADGRRAPR
jgi:hypothetical protein